MSKEKWPELKCKSSKGTISFDIPQDGPGFSYLWIGLNDEYFGTIEKTEDLKYLRWQINKILKNNLFYDEQPPKARK